MIEGHLKYSPEFLSDAAQEPGHIPAAFLRWAPPRCVRTASLSGNKKKSGVGGFSDQSSADPAVVHGWNVVLLRKQHQCCGLNAGCIHARRVS